MLKKNVKNRLLISSNKWFFQFNKVLKVKCLKLLWDSGIQIGTNFLKKKIFLKVSKVNV
jgi:hypothetical protein